MLYREIMAVCSEIHTKHINALCGLHVEMLNAKLVVLIVTTGYKALSQCSQPNRRHTKAYMNTKFLIKTKNNFKPEQSPT
jgi:hypothetical protein